MISLPCSGPNQASGETEPTGAAWISSDHRHVMDQPHLGELRVVLASEVLGAFSAFQQRHFGHSGGRRGWDDSERITLKHVHYRM